MDESAPDDGERDPSVTVTACPNGPLLLRGPFRLLDSEGEPIPKGRRTVALCRCGASSIRPFCDGTHERIGFSAPGHAENRPRPESASEKPGRVGRDGDA